MLGDLVSAGMGQAPGRLGALQHHLRARTTADALGISCAAGVTSGAGLEAPLADITIIDAGQAITGPLACSMLGDMGADVIKVESPHGLGDLNRPVGPQRNGEGIYMHNFNRGKRGIVIDTKLEAGQRALKRLALQADVFIQNSRPGAFERAGLGYDDLKALNPDLIYVSISGFGQTGPYRRRPAYDAVLQPMLGFPVMQVRNFG
jgi:crotonobetainyl-CoA:carnitine CoA-transferase CaiB-like acyl-CoA transferase